MFRGIMNFGVSMRRGQRGGRNEAIENAGLEFKEESERDI